MKLVKKLTVKSVLGKKPSAALLGEDETYDIMMVYGKAHRVQHGTHDFGDGNVSEYDKFYGDFEAVRVHDGVVVRSAVMILPEVAGDLLAGVVAELDEGASAVEFAFMVTLQKDESTSIGYQYIAEPLTKTQEKDPLADLRTMLANDKVKTLPKPEKAPEKEEPKKAAAKK